MQLAHEHRFEQRTIRHNSNKVPATNLATLCLKMMDFNIKLNKLYRKPLGQVGNGWEYPTYVLQLGAFQAFFFVSANNRKNNVYDFGVLPNKFWPGIGYINAD